MSNLIDKIFDRNIEGIQTTLDLAWKRSEAITSNIANAETPGYRAVDVSFAGELEKAFDAQQSALKTTNAKHMDVESEGMSHLIPDLSGMTRADGNNVDLDIQMARMSRNTGKYTMAAHLVQKKMQILKAAIRYAMR